MTTMQKAQPIIIFVLFVACLIMFLRTPSGHKQEIERMAKEIKTHKYKSDSISNHAKALKDSLRIALHTIRIQDEVIKQDSIKDAKQTQRHETIVFKPLANDRERDSVLANLYPSFRPIR